MVSLTNVHNDPSVDVDGYHYLSSSDNHDRDGDNNCR